MRRPVAVLLLLFAAAGTVALVARRRTDSEATPATGGPAATPPTPRARSARQAAGDDAPPQAPPGRRDVRGVVRDGADRPVADVEITVYAPDALRWRFTGRSGPDFAHPLDAVRTSADGTFTASLEASQDPRVVVARKDGFAPAAAEDRGDGVKLELAAATARDVVVVDAADRPIVGAEIVVRGIEAVADVVRTDADGRARVVVERGRGVFVRAAGLATRKWVDLSTAEGDALVRIVMREARRIAGVVVDGAGAPVTPARVVLRLSDHERRPCAIHEDECVVGPDGRFEFDGLDEDAPWPYVVSASAPGRLWADVEAFPGQPDVRLVLVRPGTVRGVVTYRGGAPAERPRDAWPRLDDHDRFELTDVRAGRRVVRAWAVFPSSATWYGSATVDVLDGGVVENVAIDLAPAIESESYVLGRVVSADGRADECAHVVAWRDGAAVGRGRPDGDGNFLVAIDAPAGTEVVVTASDLMDEAVAPGVAAVTSATRPSTPFTLQLGPPCALRLRLVDAEGREITATRADIQNGWPDPKPREDGTYPLRANDSSWFRIRVPGFATRLVEFAPPHPSLREETVRLEPENRIVGRVVDADGRPARDLTVRDDLSTRNDTVVGRGLRDDGRFEIGALPVGRAKLRVCARHDVLLFREVEVAGGGVDLGDLRLPERRALRFVAVDEVGRPLGGAQAVFLDPGDEPVCANAASRPDGTFEAVVADGIPVRVLVRRCGFGTRSFAPERDAAQPFRVALPPAGAVRVRATAAVGPGVVEARDPAPGARPWAPHTEEDRPRIASADGVLYDDFPPGPTEVTLVTPRRRLVRTVAVVAGETVDCLFGE